MKKIHLITLLLLLLFTSIRFALADQKKSDYRFVIYDFKLSIDVTNYELSVTVPDLLRIEITKVPRFLVLERDQMAKLYYDRYRAEKLPKVYDQNTAIKLGKVFEANYSVIGRISRIKDKLQIITKIVDNETSVIVAGETIIVNFLDIEDFYQEIKNLAKALINQISGIPSQGILYLEVEPSNVIIKFKQKSGRFKSPLIQKLTPGKYTVYIEPYDDFIYTKTERMFEIKPGQKTNLKVKLELRKGKLYFDPKINQAIIYIDGKSLSSLKNRELLFKTGQHRIAIITRRGLIYYKDITVKPNIINKIDFSFQLNNLYQKAEFSLIAKSKINRSIAKIDIFESDILLLDKNGVFESVNAFNHQKRWIFNEYEVVNSPIILEKRLFILCREDEIDDYGAITNYHFLIELDPFTGNKLWTSKKYESNRVQSVCQKEKAVIIFNEENIFLLKSDSKEPRIINIRPDSIFKLNRDVFTISGQLMIFLNSIRKSIYAFHLTNGEFAWRRDFDNEIYNIAGFKECLVVATKNDQVLFINPEEGTNFYKIIDARDIKFIYSHDKLIYIFAVDGTFWEFDRTKNIELKKNFGWFEPKALSNCKLDCLGRFAIIVGSHRIMQYDPDINYPIWIYEQQGRFNDLALNKAFIAVSTESGNLFTFGNSTFIPVIGWIEEIIPEESSIVIRTIREVDDYKYDFIATDINKLISKGQIINQDILQFRIEKILSKDKEFIKVQIDPNSKDLKIGHILLSPGAIDVKTDIQNSYIWLDNSFVGVTPKKILGLSRETHSIKIVHPERKIWSSTFSLKDSWKYVINIQLEPVMEKSLNIITSPAESDIYIDNNLKGKSPISIYGLREDQTVGIRIERLSYKTIEDRIIIKKIKTKNYKLKFAPKVFSFYLNAGIKGIFLIKGWQERDIIKEGVIGKPIRKGSKFTLLPQFKLEYRYKIFQPFLSIEGDYFGDYHGEGGMKIFLGKIPLIGETEIGCSYDFWPAGHQQSYPPSWGDGESDPEAPLEYWSHPIQNVFIENSSKRYLNGILSIRPISWLFLHSKLSILSKTQLKGIALVQDDAGRLIKDSDRYYNFSSNFGRRIGLSLEIFLGEFLSKLMPNKDFVKNLALKLSYSYSKTDFLVEIEEGSVFSIGIGLILF